MSALATRLQNLLPRPVDNVPASRSYRLAYALAGGTLVIVALSLAIYLVTAVLWQTRPFFGVMLSPTQMVLNGGPLTSTRWPGRDAGLRPRDVVIAIDGQTLAEAGDFAGAHQRINSFLNEAQIGQSVTVTVRGIDGATRDVSYLLRSFPTGDFLVYFLIPFLAGLIAWCAGMIVFFWRGHQPGALLSATLCALIGLLLAGIFDQGRDGLLAPLWMIGTATIGGIGVTLGLTYPSVLPVVYRVPVLRYIALPVSGLIGVVAAILVLSPTRSYDVSPATVIAVGTAVTGALMLLGLVIVQRRRAISRTVRDQSGVVLIGIVLSTIPGVVWIAAQIIRIFDPSYALPLTIEAALPFVLTLVFSVTFSQLGIRRVDSDGLITQSITYTILLAALIAGYFFLTLGAGLLASSVLPNNPLLIAATLFVVAALFLPVRSRLQNRIDAIFFRQRRQLQGVVEDFSQLLSELTDTDKAIDSYMTTVERGISPTHAIVFVQRALGGDYMAARGETELRFSSDSALVKHLHALNAPLVFSPDQPLPGNLVSERARIEVLKPHVMLGLSGSDRIFGFVVLGGPKGDRQAYAFEEMRFVSALTTQLSVSVERAQSVETLQQRVKELDVLSSMGQASNFTRTLDDLLELISAQTNRLLRSQFQYIVLFDRDVEQLYFAFFLEEDERYVEREGLRWALGNDIYSEILRSGQSRRYADYSREKQMGTFGAVYDSEHIHAWMAVPLVAQNRRLGVFALGKKDTLPYSADDMATFVNLAGLAATALEKAQLFDEVNQRARQLGALNEVSRQLVAAEAGDVDTLLHLITESAVTILEAEAGSLLLRAEEDSDDMVFRVVIGDASEELTGTRVSQDRGLIGAVLRTKQPQIANDTRVDTRWQGDVSKSGFRTTSILAVPLMAKDDIVGVLEVLNKTSGQPFTQDEVRLLSTFASQAGVAIENARLFEMTGSALNQRLEELQTLASIDRDLARALDQREVAKITVKWAKQMTGAEALVCGEVNLSSQTMRVLSIEGYEPSEYPEGADGSIWPLTKGIVRRVLRNGVPDLADLRYDPDHVPSHRNAVSQMTVPMMSGDSIIAMLVMETSAEPFRLTDLDFVNRLAERASIALANAQLYERIVNAAENKSAFVAFAAHELKNPLTSIKGYSDTLLNPRISGAMNAAQREQFLGVIRTNAERMQGIIDDLRDIAASDAGKLQIAFEPLQFNTVVQDTLTPFEQQFEQKEQKVNIAMPEKLPSVYGDHKKLVQVLTNLVSNAHKYSPAGTSISIAVEQRETYQLPSGHDLGPSILVSVKDSGIGMSPTDLKRIFQEDYFRSDDSRARAQKGTGLGMMITQRLVEAHGGRIWVESELDHGSNFQFVIPLDRRTDKPTGQTGSRRRIVMTGAPTPSSN
ncbi:MAG: GAF domain-containing protein [Chloroflexi bacterium]|nr:GAF domain-containing protein [Chloroflexota bacterium]